MSAFEIELGCLAMCEFNVLPLTLLVNSLQLGQQTNGDQSAFPWLIVIAVLVLLFLIVAILVIGLTIFLIARRRSQGKRIPAGVVPTSVTATPGGPAFATPEPSPAPPSPSVPIDLSSPAVSATESSMTVDLSRTVAIVPDGDTAPISYGSIRFVSGVIAGKEFAINPEGSYIGRDSSVSQIVLSDPRISKRHLWIGVRDGHVVISDQGSRNGTFLNDPKSSRITESDLNPGETVILGESDVARFEYVK